MNEKNSIKVRQICFLYLAFVPVTKISLYPCILSRYVGERLWLACILGFAFNLAIIGAALYLNEKHKGKPIYEILINSIGKTGAKIVFAIFAVFFLLKAVLPLIEQKTYIESTLYELMPSSFIFYPFFALSVFVCLKGLKIFGRIGDLAVFVTAVGLLLALFITVPVGDFTNLLPLLQKPDYNLINGVFRTILWHSDGIYMFMFLGHFNAEKNYKKKIVFSFVGTAAASVIFVCAYYAIYGPIAASQNFALPSMTVFGVSGTNVGRFDFMAIFLLLFSQVFATIFPIFSSVKCLERVFGCKSAALPTAVVNAVMLAITAFFEKKLFTVLDLTTNVLSYFFLFVSVAVTLFLVILPRRKNETA